MFLHESNGKLENDNGWGGTWDLPMEPNGSQEVSVSETREKSSSGFDSPFREIYVILGDMTRCAMSPLRTACVLMWRLQPPVNDWSSNHGSEKGEVSEGVSRVPAVEPKLIVVSRRWKQGGLKLIINISSSSRNMWLRGWQICPCPSSIMKLRTIALRVR